MQTKYTLIELSLQMGMYRASSNVCFGSRLCEKSSSYDTVVLQPQWGLYMTDFIKGEDRSQATLFPDQLDDYIAEDSLVQVTDNFVDRFETVSDEEVLQAMRLAFQIVEPSGAVGLAAALNYLRKETKRVAIAIISGGNVDLEWFCKTVTKS